MTTHSLTFLNNNDDQPAIPIIQPTDKSMRPLAWLHQQRAELDKHLLKHGGILLRGFNINSLS